MHPSPWFSAPLCDGKPDYHQQQAAGPFKVKRPLHRAQKRKVIDRGGPQYLRHHDKQDGVSDAKARREHGDAQNVEPDDEPARKEMRRRVEQISQTAHAGYGGDCHAEAKPDRKQRRSCDGRMTRRAPSPH